MCSLIGNMYYDNMGLYPIQQVLHNYTCALDNVWLYNMTYVTCVRVHTQTKNSLCGVVFVIACVLVYLLQHDMFQWAEYL